MMENAGSHTNEEGLGQARVEQETTVTERPSRGTVRRKPWILPTALMLTGLGMGAAWYGFTGFWKDPEESFRLLALAQKNKDRNLLRSLLSSDASQTLRNSELDVLLKHLPRYEDSGLNHTIQYPDGLARIFARKLNIHFKYNRDGTQNEAMFKTMPVFLENGQWKINSDALYTAALQISTERLEDKRAALRDYDSMPKADIVEQRKSATDLHSEIKILLQSAKDLNENFAASSNTDNVSKVFLTINEKLTRLERVNAVESLFVKALALSEGGDLEATTTTLKEVLTSTVATDEQKSRARGILSSTGTATSEDRLSEANRMYDRGDYQSAIRLIQEVLDNPDSTNDQEARAQYLLSFAFRDYEDAPNHMQKAIDAARAATELEPTNADYWCTLGGVLRNYKVYQAADEAFKKGIEVAYNANTKADCYVWQGANNYDAGEYEIARYLWRTALDLDPTNADAKRFLGDDLDY